MNHVPSPLPFTGSITGRAAWRGLLGLAAIWLVAGCTRLTPPRYNLSSSDPPRLLLQTDARIWIGVRHADRRGVFAMSPAFATGDSLMCVYKDKISYEFKEATNKDFKDTHIRGCAGYLKTTKLPRRLLAVIATPDASPAKAAATATPVTGEPRDGIMCTRRCNRTRRPGQYLKIEIVAAAAAPALPLPPPTPPASAPPPVPPAPQGEAPTPIAKETP